MTDNFYKKTADRLDLINTKQTESTGYRNIFYVSPDGDNSNGLTWATAFTTINAAYAAASSDMNDTTKIKLSVGTFDININPRLDIEKNIQIEGAGRTKSVITNSHGNATSIFFQTAESLFRIKHCKLHDSGRGSAFSAIGIYHGDARGEIEDCYFDFSSMDESAFIVTFSGGATRSWIKNCIIVGGTSGSTGPTGIRMSDSYHNQAIDCTISECGKGISIQYFATANNHAESCEISDCYIGISISDGDDTTLRKNKIRNCSYGVKVGVGATRTLIDDIIMNDCSISNIDDDSITTSVARAVTPTRNHIYPEDLIGVNVVGSENIEEYGANTVIIPSGTIDGPFKILAFTFAPTDDKKFLLRFSHNGGTDHFFHAMTRKDGNNGELERETIMLDDIFKKGTEISASVAGEVEDESVYVWLYYQKI